jgi:hypothetical protein
MPTAAPPRPAVLHALADLLEDNAEVVADAIADARDKGPRVRDVDGFPADRDSGEVLAELIDTLRGAS